MARSALHPLVAAFLLLVLPPAATAAEQLTFGVQMAPEKTSYDDVVRTAQLVDHDLMRRFAVEVMPALRGPVGGTPAASTAP